MEDRIGDRMEVNKTGSIVTVSFPEEEVIITAQNIEDKFGHFSAEIYVHAVLPYNGRQVSTQLDHSRTDLLDISDKNRLVSTLEDQTSNYPSRFYWGDTINRASDEIIDKYRQGEPEVVMGGLDNHTTRIYALRPLFVEGVASIIWARGGSAKSYFGLLSCVAIDKGLSVMGLKARKGVALYLDWEETHDVFKQRLAAVHRGLGLPLESGIIYKRMSGSLQQNLQNVSRIVMKHNVTFMVVDSVGAALGGNGVDANVVGDYFDAGNELGITWVSIDHANRAGETTGNWAIHGSAYKYNRARQVFEVKKVQENDSGYMEMVLYHRKTNDSGIQSPRGFSVAFKSEDHYVPEEEDFEKRLVSVTFESLALGNADNELLKGLGIAEICHELIKTHGPTRISQLAESVGIIKDVEGLTEDTIENSVNNYNQLTIGIDNETVSETPAARPIAAEQEEVDGQWLIE